jgi:hypothetical protein
MVLHSSHDICEYTCKMTIWWGPRAHAVEVVSERSILAKIVLLVINAMIHMEFSWYDLT